MSKLISANYYDVVYKDTLVRIVRGGFDLSKIDNKVPRDSIEYRYEKYIYRLDSGEIIASLTDLVGVSVTIRGLLSINKAGELMRKLDSPKIREEKLRSLLDE